MGRTNSGLWSYAFSDWGVNSGSLRIRLVLLSFRLAQRSLTLPFLQRLAMKPFRTGHKVVVGWLLGMDIPLESRIGQGLRIQHGYGLVIHGQSVIGEFCTLRQGVTLGIRGGGRSGDGPPTLGHRVDVGSGAQLLGRIAIGNDARIGSLAVVLADVPDGGTAVGNPARNLTDNGRPRPDTLPPPSQVETN